MNAINRIQGYIVLEPNHTGYNGTQCIYIPFVASAPWNRNIPHGGNREFRNIGKILLAFSSLLGYGHNANPELELCSLPGAEGFYRRIGMIETGRITNGLKEFHMNEPEAYDLLRFLIPHLIGD